MVDTALGVSHVLDSFQLRNYFVTLPLTLCDYSFRSMRGYFVSPVERSSEKKIGASISF